MSTPSYKRGLSHGHPSADKDGHVLLHVLIAEQALGRYLPDGAEVHHADGNIRNNVNANLVICQDKAYHKLLHVRARTLRAGGNPNTDKFCADCQKCKPFEAFNVGRAHKSTGRQPICRECQKIRFAEWWRKRDIA